jgi:hypothetical protein
MTDMPSEALKPIHPLQVYMMLFNLSHDRLDDEKLQKMWRLYLELIIADTGEVMMKLLASTGSRKIIRFDPSVQLTHDGRLAWAVHAYLF